MAELAKLGRYELRRVLGKGAMGVVYEGFDPMLNRRVAVKTILKSVAIDEATQRDYSVRFVREAQAVARLNHPHIVQVHDFGEQDEVAYLVMEFIEGRELRAYFDEGVKFGTAEAVRIMRELLDALDFAHDAGVIHRDVKPANVMLDAQRQVKLADFGVARIQDSDRSAVGTMVGTPAFMSPEQVQGLKIDRRTDIFSAGVILYQLLTGEQPFKGEGAWTVATKIVRENPPLPSSLVRSVSPVFDGIVYKALAKRPADRFPNAKEFRAALRTAERAASTPGAQAPAMVVSGPPATDKDATVAIGKTARVPEPSTAGKRSLVVPAVAALVVAAGVAAYLIFSRVPAPPAPVAQAPTPAAPAIDVEKVRRETEERIRREYSDKSTAEQAAAIKAATEKAIQEMLAATKADVEKAAIERAAAKAVQEKAAQEKAILEKAAAIEKAAVERTAAAERVAAAEKAAKAAAEKAAEEKAAAAKAAEKAAEPAKAPPVTVAAAAPAAAAREPTLAGRYAFHIMAGSGGSGTCDRNGFEEDVEIKSTGSEGISGREFSDLRLRSAPDGSVTGSVRDNSSRVGTADVKLAGRATATGYAGTYGGRYGLYGCTGQWTLVRKGAGRGEVAAAPAKTPPVTVAAAAPAAAPPREGMLPGRYAFRIMTGSGLYSHCDSIDVQEDIEIRAGSSQSISGRNFTNLQFQSAQEGSVAATLQEIRTRSTNGGAKLTGRATITGYSGTYQFNAGPAAFGCTGQWTLVRKGN